MDGEGGREREEGGRAEARIPEGAVQRVTWCWNKSGRMRTLLYGGLYLRLGKVYTSKIGRMRMLQLSATTA